MDEQRQLGLTLASDCFAIGPVQHAISVDSRKHHFLARRATIH